MSSVDSTQPDGSQAATPDNSPEAVKPNSLDPAKFEEILLNRFDAFISNPKTIQALKDRTFGEMKKDKDWKDFLAEYKGLKAKGMTDEQIENEARLRDIESRLSAPVPQSDGKQVAPQQTDLATQFASWLGLDNDPEVTTLLASDRPQEEKAADLRAIHDRKINPPNPAAVAQSAGGAPKPDLMAEYKAKAANTYGNALIDLKMEYRKKGLDIT